LEEVDQRCAPPSCDWTALSRPTRAHRSSRSRSGSEQGLRPAPPPATVKRHARRATQAGTSV